MSELTNVPNSQRNLRRHLFATVSSATLVVSVCGANATNGTPSVWIELGGQFAQNETGQDAFLPPFVLTTPRPPFAVVSPQQVEKASPWIGTGSAKITFEPSDTSWVLSAGIIYGRSGRKEKVNQQTPNLTAPYRTASGRSHFAYGTEYDAYQRITSRSSQSHTILDFQAGKDFGLGMWGKGGNSTISFGVRYVQFDSASSAAIASQPTNVNDHFPFHKHFADFSAERKFSGVGPAVSWDASAKLTGNTPDGGIAFDWGLNGAMLFGRQRMKGQHQTTNLLHTQKSTAYYVSKTIRIYRQSASPNRSKQVTVPNFGGFAGLSWRYPNAKVSLGYRADFFFGAMDGGVDAPHRENVGFYGPFASISVGLGG